jgi:hypothetical protein
LPSHAHPDGSGNAIFSDENVDIDVSCRVARCRPDAEPGERRCRNAHANDADRLSPENRLTDDEERAAAVCRLEGRLRSTVKLASQLTQADCNQGGRGDCPGLAKEVSCARSNTRSVRPVPRRQHGRFDVSRRLHARYVLAQVIERRREFRIAPRHGTTHIAHLIVSR